MKRDRRQQGFRCRGWLGNGVPAASVPATYQDRAIHPRSARFGRCYRDQRHTPDEGSGAAANQTLGGGVR